MASQLSIALCRKSKGPFHGTQSRFVPVKNIGFISHNHTQLMEESNSRIADYPQGLSSTVLIAVCWFETLCHLQKMSVKFRQDVYPRLPDKSSPDCIVLLIQAPSFYEARYLFLACFLTVLL